MLVRELVAHLGFNVNQSALNKFDTQLGLIKKKLGGMNRNLNQIADGLGRFGRNATLYLTAPIVALGVAAVKTASDFEQLNVAFSTMLGSSEKANEFVEEMTQFAAKTPFTIKGVFQSSKQLLAMGIEAEKIKPTLKALGDISAGLSVPIGRLAFNFGQVRAAGKLTGRELRDFVTAGVPLLDTLGQTLGKTSNEIRDMISAGDISFKMVEDAFLAMSNSGGRFEDLMKKQMNTIGGIFSNLLDNIIILGRTFGDIIVKTLKLKERLKALTEVVGRLLKFIKELQPHQQKLLIAFTAFFILIGPLTLGLAALIKIVTFISTAFVVLKTALFGATGGAIAFNASLLIIPILIIAAVTALALFIDDVWTWVKGGDSLVGKLIGPWEKFRDVVVDVFDKLKSRIASYFSGIKSGLKRTQDEMQPMFDWFRREWELFVELMSLEIPIPKWLQTIGSFFKMLFKESSSLGVTALSQQTGNQFSGSGFGGIGSMARGLTSMNVYNQNKVEVVQGNNEDSVTTAKKISDQLNKKINENLEQKFRMVANSNLIYE